MGALCAFLIGVAKTGVPGLGILVVPMMVLVVGDARQSAGWLLPTLCIADIFALYYWRRHAAANKLFSLAPWVLIGVVAGAVALALNERILRPLIGVIVLLMLITYLWRRWNPALGVDATHAAPFGIAAGFATTVANAAGPVMNIYLLRKQLPKHEFMAMGAWFFFLINLSKIPIYSYHGLFSTQALVFNLLTSPAVLLGSLTGRWLVDRIPAKLFELLVVLLTAGSTILLFR
ncbi:MAG TPA: sulfite exporter TauE/SafE family protein [Bryobacteraceae bacterium]|nr:sulfite exporter TauE/SafE family protein [Bryobacteraceae bacterium]